MKERFQNPVIGNEVRLRLFSYNSNARTNVDSIEKVEIYFLDPHEKTAENPDGRRLVKTITDITAEEVGLYSVIVELEADVFTLGKYIDIWYVTIGTQTAEIPNEFAVYPNLWFTTPLPIIYDFNFSFRPNRLLKGSKRYLAIEIVPNVPNRNELYAYYENLATISPVKISIEQECVPCMPAEQDLRLVIDAASVDLRERCMGYYYLDTTDMAVGMYNVWFSLEMGDIVHISEKQQIQIV